MADFSFSDFLGGVGDVFTGGDGFDTGDVFRNISGAVGAYDALKGTQEQKPYFFPGQEQGLAMAGSAAQDAFQQGPQQYYPGQTVAGLDPNVVAGQNQQLGSTDLLQNMANLSGTAAGALSEGGAGRIGGFQLPGQPGYGLDPEFAGAIMDPINRNLTEEVLPALRTGATSQGAFGGSRALQQEGKAAGRATELATKELIRNQLAQRQQDIGLRAGDISAQLSGRGQDIQQNQIENAARAAGISGTGAALSQQLVPGEVQTGVGADRTAYEQQLINADKTRFDFNQQAPQTSIDQLFARMQGLPAPIVGAGAQPGTFLDALQGFGLGSNIWGGLTTPAPAAAPVAAPRI